VPLQTSGQISLSDIQTEFGGSNPISISEYYGIRAGVPSSGQISLSNFYNKGVLSATYLGRYYQPNGSANFTLTVNNGAGTANDLIVVCWALETAGGYAQYSETFTLNNTAMSQAIFENPLGSGGAGTSRVGIWYMFPSTQTSIVGDTTLTLKKTSSSTHSVFRSAATVYRINNGAQGTISGGGSQVTGQTSSISASNSNTTNKLIVVASQMADGSGHTLSTNNGTITQHDLINSGSANGFGKSGFVTGPTGTNTVTLTRVGTGGSSSIDTIVTAVIA